MDTRLSEGFIRQTYKGDSGVHHSIFPINFSGTPTPGTEPILSQKDGTTVSAITGYADFLSHWLKAFDADTLFGLAEAYAVDPETGEGTFIFGWDVADNGAAAGSSVTLAQATFTYKTIGGGLVKLVAMEGIFGVNQKLVAPFAVDSVAAELAAYMSSGDAIIIGRDNTYAFAPISLTVKTSDALRKRVGL